MRTRFAEFIIDSDTRQLQGGGRDVHLSPKAFDLLCLLIEAAPKVVEKADLYSRIWPSTHVVDANLNILIGEIRRALRDSPQDPRFIRTVHGVGYAFCATPLDLPGARAAAEVPLCWVVSEGRIWKLSEGENSIGRDPRSDVWLDAPGVSRRHAIIRIDSHTRCAILEDLGSTNGTFVRRAPVDGQGELTDGDLVQVGTVDLTVRLWGAYTAKTKRMRPRNK